jgi:predicted CXXCH cytochrome family protein
MVSILASDQHIRWQWFVPSCVGPRVMLVLLALSIPSALFAEQISKSAECQNCHLMETHAWQQSHHAKAMQIPNRNAVLAPFNGESATFSGLTARFFIDGSDVEPSESLTLDAPSKKRSIDAMDHPFAPSEFKIELSDKQRSGAGEAAVYPVIYTFGVTPLQQYLIERAPGQLQVAPFAFDTRLASEGGQTWFHLDEKAGLPRHPRLDWDQPLQSWNGMCADCHSTGLTRGFDRNTQRFETELKEVSVGCLSCHVPHAADREESLINAKGRAHAVASSVHPENASIESTSTQGVRGWHRAEGAKVAVWMGAERDTLALETCYGCHALRAPLVDGIHPMAAFLDQFKPELLRAPFYSSTGQIEEEVYVFGSFEQSRMRAAGVQCVDCHDPHTAKVRVEGNGLCTSCHKAEAYEGPTHSGHPIAVAVQCVDCHMPGKVYMGVDFRRDHQFALPDPGLAKRLGARDVCQDCHEDRWSSWLANREADGREVEGSTRGHRDRLLFTPHHQARAAYWTLHSQPASPQTDGEYAGALKDGARSPIERASLIATRTPETIARWTRFEWWYDLVKDPSPLVRATALEKMSHAVPIPDALMTALCQDVSRLVRVAAGATPGAATLIECLEARGDYQRSIDQIAWRAEGTLTEASLAIAETRVLDAVESLRFGMELDPFAAALYLNLADVYRGEGNEAAAVATLDEGLTRLPDEGYLLYGRGLAAVRARDQEKALDLFERAVAVEPENIDFVIANVLLLEALGEIEQAVLVLDTRFKSQAMPPQLMALRQRLWMQSARGLLD